MLKHGRMCCQLAWLSLAYYWPHTCCFLMGLINTFPTDWISCKLCTHTTNEAVGTVSKSSYPLPLTLFFLCLFFLIFWLPRLLFCSYLWAALLPHSFLFTFLPSVSSHTPLSLFFSAANPPCRNLHSPMLLIYQRAEGLLLLLMFVVECACICISACKEQACDWTAASCAIYTGRKFCNIKSLKKINNCFAQFYEMSWYQKKKIILMDWIYLVLF